MPSKSERRNPEPWSDDAFLFRMLNVGDPPADEVAKGLMAKATFIYPFMNRLKDMRNLHATGTIEPAFVDAYFRDHHDREPEWLRPECIRTAQDLFDKHSLNVIVSLFCASLPECYAVEEEAEILDHTGLLRRETNHRVRQTGRLLLAVMDRDGLERELPGDRRWLSGRLAALQVRLLHAIMRHRLGGGYLAPRPKSKTLLREYQDVERWLMAFRPQPAKKGGKGLRPSPKHLNQLQLSYTLLTFSYVIVRSLRQLGIRWKKEEVDSYLHTWNYVGWLLGVRTELMAWSYEEAEQLFGRLKATLEPGSSPPEKGRLLTSALLEMLEQRIPGKGKPDLIPTAMTRHLLGKESADRLGVDEVGGVPSSFQVTAGLFEVLRRLGVDFVDLLKDKATDEFSLNLDVDPLIQRAKEGDPVVEADSSTSPRE